MQLIRSIRTVILSALILMAWSVHAATPKFAVNENGIYKVEAAGKRELIYRSGKGEALLDSTFSVSPNQSWALVDFVPSNPGKGRVEEVRILISLTTGARLGQEKFQAKYEAWLDESADWDSDKPATIVLGNGKTVPLGK